MNDFSHSVSKLLAKEKLCRRLRLKMLMLVSCYWALWLPLAVTLLLAGISGKHTSKVGGNVTWVVASISNLVNPGIYILTNKSCARVSICVPF